MATENKASKPSGRRVLSIRTIGGLEFRFEDRAIDIAGKKSRALLGYLAIEERRESRERLVGLFWSESEEGRARGSLRQCLHEIREKFHAVSFEGLEAGKQFVSLDRVRIHLDIWDLLSQATKGLAHPRLLEGDDVSERILADVDSVDPVFHTWIVAKRQSFRATLTRDLEAALRASAPGDDAGEKCATALLNLDRTHEEACRFLMRARAARGDVGGALNVYNALWEVLDREHDVEPSEQTQRLVAQIKMAQPLAGAEPAAKPTAPPPDAAPALPEDIRPPAPRAAGPGDTKLVVSVAAFDVSGARKDQHYLVHGFRRELIASLVRFREWMVCDQGSGVGDQQLPSGPVSEFVIEASAFQDEEGLRLVLMLRDVATKAYLWSERLQISMAKWLDAQQTVVRRLAAAVNVHLSAGRLASHGKTRAKDLKAYDLWLQGQALVLSFLPTDWHRAVELFQEVIATTPDFAPAYSSLAQLHNTIHYAHPGVFRSVQRVDQALEYARTATRLDPVDSRGQLCLGWAYALSGNFELGAVHHAIAEELNDNDPWTLLSAGLGFAFGGDIDRARQLARRALHLTLNPNPIHWRYQAIIRFMDRDYEGCVAAAQLADPVVPNALGWKASALHHLGRDDAAKAELANFYEIVGGRWFGNDAPDRRIMTRWFLHAFPIRHREDWERLRDGLAAAGAPVTGLKHGSW